MQADPIFSFCVICLLDQKCDIPKDCVFHKFQQLYRETEIAIQISLTHKKFKNSCKQTFHVGHSPSHMFTRNLLFFS